MSDSQDQPWSDSPDAPNIPLALYRLEKAWFAGILIGSILYGMLVVLFFKCMTALFNPVHRRGEGIKWGLVAYTVIMFSLVTVHTATKDHIFSISYIDNRDFPIYGPYGYADSIDSGAINVLSNAAFNLNNWLADGLLLYRCYIFYSTNLWVIAFPCFVYLGSVATGIVLICQTADPTIGSVWFGLPYISISLSLNVLLTLMIVVRLVLLSRNIRATVGSQAGIGGLCNSIATMLVESSALFAVSSLLVIGTWPTPSPVGNVFPRILAETQVIASLLIIQRVANKSALTSKTMTPGSTISFNPRTQGGLTGDSGAPTGGSFMRSTGKHGATSGDLGVGVETVIDFHRDKV